LKRIKDQQLLRRVQEVIAEVISQSLKGSIPLKGGTKDSSRLCFRPFVSASLRENHKDIFT